MEIEINTFYDWLKYGVLTDINNISKFRYSSIPMFIDETYKELLPFLDDKSKQQMINDFTNGSSIVYNELCNQVKQLLGECIITPIGVLLEHLTWIDQGISKKQILRFTLCFIVVVKLNENSPESVTRIYDKFFFFDVDLFDKIDLRTKIESLYLG